jgi:hypothetical protein
MMQSIISREFGSLLGALTLFGCIPAGINSPVQPSGAAGEMFPDVIGTDLEGKEISLPSGLAGRRTLVALAFEREHQPVVDSWIARVEPLLAQDPELCLYEVPIIYESSTLFRLWLNNGMRAGITDQVARRRTITIYVDREQFNATLSIPDTSDVHLLLLNAEGRITWRSTGPANDEKVAALSQALVNGQSLPKITRFSQAPAIEGASVLEREPLGGREPSLLRNHISVTTNPRSPKGDRQIK